jgi:lysophospholipase L1-like esterase
MNPARAHKMSAVGRLIVAVTGLALGLLIAEGLVRLLDVAPDIETMSHEVFRYSDNPKIGWEPVPPSERRTSERAVNDLGYRDRNHPVAKPPGVVRIIVIGDSIAYGTRIRDDAAIFPRVLETELRRRGLPAEVQNFGVPGYNTQQEVETLVARGLTYTPDVVVLSYCLNDRSLQAGDTPYTMARSAVQRKAVDESRTLEWLSRSALFRFLYFGVFYTFAGAQTEIDRRFGGVLADTVRPSFERLSELSRANNFRVIVAVFPMFRKRKAEDFEGYAFLADHEYVRALSEEHHFDHLDLLETFRACAKEGPVAIDIFHPNERGHRCAAEAIAEAVNRARATEG